MRNSASAAVLSGFALAFAFSTSPAQAQSTPIEPAQSPQQSEQSREQDRSRAEDVTIGRDWKAQGGETDHAGQASPNDDHQTVGQDWRARPDSGGPQIGCRDRSSDGGRPVLRPVLLVVRSPDRSISRASSPHLGPVRKFGALAKSRQLAGDRVEALHRSAVVVP
jgi:hypothetical protein